MFQILQAIEEIKAYVRTVLTPGPSHRGEVADLILSKPKIQRRDHKAERASEGECGASILSNGHFWYKLS